MTREEFQTEVGDYATKLWPKLVLTSEQAEMWFHKLRWYSTHDARAVLGEAYATVKWQTPVLGDVVALLRIKTRMNPVTGELRTDKYQEQVEREEREEEDLLADWAPEEFENGKAEIIRNEPAMAIMAELPARGTFWIHFLVERYFYGRATVFTRQNGKLVNPMQVTRDVYWAKAGPA